MIMMTLVNGPNLHDVIFSGKHPVRSYKYSYIAIICMFALPYQQTLNLTIKFHIGIQLCQALTFMHSSSPPVAHLDIKPSNILVSFVLRYNIL